MNPAGDNLMRSRRTVPFVLLLAFLSGGTPEGHAGERPPLKESPPRGFRVERIEQQRTEAISWIRVEVVADTETEATWAVLQNVEEWERFLGFFSGVTPVERTETMTRYRLSVSPPWPIRDFITLIWMAKLPAERMMLWRSNREDLTASHGRLEVKQIPGGTRVIYEFHSPAKKAFPPWVVRIGLYLVLPGVVQDFYDRIQQQE